MTDSFRLLLSGLTKSSNKTVANILHEKFGWKIVDWNKIMIHKIDKLRACESNWPNNSLAESYDLVLFEEKEWNSVLEVKLI